jgi:hypothetical protein
LSQARHGRQAVLDSRRGGRARSRRSGVSLDRYEPDGSSTVLAVWGRLLSRSGHTGPPSQTISGGSSDCGRRQIDDLDGPRPGCHRPAGHTESVHCRGPHRRRRSGLGNDGRRQPRPGILPADTSASAHLPSWSRPRSQRWARQPGTLVDEQAPAGATSSPRV